MLGGGVAIGLNSSISFSCLDTRKRTKKKVKAVNSSDFGIFILSEFFILAEIFSSSPR